MRTRTRHTTILATLAWSLSLAACAPAVRGTASDAPKVGPPRGTVMVVGGGAVGPEIVSRFIEAAGGPGALIVDVPTAGGDTAYPANWRGANFLRAGGAKNIVILHTNSKGVANTDDFAAVLARAGGVWFEGGRQWHLADNYGCTKTEAAFHAVLDRGGVVGGSSAGASILSSYMLRGARGGNEVLMAPGSDVGFGFLRNTAIDQHVVARSRLADLADTLMPRRPDLLGISEDEGTAWVVRGDQAEIIGRNKAFVYGGRDQTDARKPFLTLYPGDRYDLGARRVTHRAWDDSPVAAAFVDSLMKGVSAKTTVLVAQAGKVYIDRAYNVPDHPKYMPGTTLPNFTLGDVSEPINSLMSEIASARDAKRFTRAYSTAITRRIFTPIGAHQMTVDSTGAFMGNVDELYRLELGLENPRAFSSDSTGLSMPAARDESLGWAVDTFHGVNRFAAYGDVAGHLSAFVRFPERRAVVILLSEDHGIDARGIAEQISARLIP